MTFGSLFAGIGGFDLGLEWAGMECKWQVEIDKECLKDLKHHWPNVPKFEDIKEITELPYVDLICGGFPCQDISNAGKRKGITGERSGLWKEMLRIIRMVRPKYIIVENVAALINRGLCTVLGDLAASGYDAEWQVLSAAMFGLPHYRKRIFIIAYPNSKRFYEREIFPKYYNKKEATTQEKNKVVKFFSSGSYNIEFQSKDKYFVSGKDDGVSRRVHRLRALGNAVVPQIVEYIGKLIINFDKN